MNRALKKEVKFQACVTCNYRIFSDVVQAKCAGPRLSALEMPDWRDHIWAVMEFDHLTYKIMADRSNGQLSEKTLQNILAKNAVGGINRDTARLVENTIYSPDGAQACYLAHIESQAAQTADYSDKDKEIEDLILLHAKTHETYQAELELVREEARREREEAAADNLFLREQIRAKDAEISRLSESNHMMLKKILL